MTFDAIYSVWDIKAKSVSLWMGSHCYLDGFRQPVWSSSLAVLVACKARRDTKGMIPARMLHHASIGHHPAHSIAFVDHFKIVSRLKADTLGDPQRCTGVFE